MIYEKLVTLIAEQFGIDEKQITPETSFTNDLNADSVDLVVLVMAIESEFGLDEDDDNDYSSIHTVSDAEQYIRDRT